MSSDREYDSGDDTDEDHRASAMIAAPPARKSVNVKPLESRAPIDLMDERAIKMAKTETTLFSVLNPQRIKRLYRKKKKKEKPLSDRERVENDPTLHPYYKKHQLAKKLSFSQVNEHNIDRQALEDVLRDFFAFYDPVISQQEVNELLNFAIREGLHVLNDRLKDRYQTGLILTEAVINDKETTVFSNNKEVVHSAKLIRALTTPGLEDRENVSGLRLKDDNLNKQLEAAIVVLEMSQSAKDMKVNLINFYRLAEPERLDMWERGETKDFIGEILAWTIRFGVKTLGYNLRERFELGNVQIDSTRAKLPFANLNRTEHDPDSPKWDDAEYVRKSLERFYVVYNPNRLERPLDTIIDYILESGVEEFNQILTERYNDNLFTFESSDHVMWRGVLLQQLFDFFTKVDAKVISQGLNTLIHWTERQDNKLDDLNKYLMTKYGQDLTILDKKPNEQN